MHYPSVTQRRFLEVMGLEMRKNLVKNHVKDPEQKKAVESQYERLMDPSGMGGDYKVMCLGRADSKLLPGFWK